MKRMDGSGAVIIKRDFIFKMVELGWSVWKLDEKTYNFQRAHHGQLEKYEVVDFLPNFLGM